MLAIQDSSLPDAVGKVLGQTIYAVPKGMLSLTAESMAYAAPRDWPVEQLLEGAAATQMVFVPCGTVSGQVWMLFAGDAVVFRTARLLTQPRTTQETAIGTAERGDQPAAGSTNEAAAVEAAVAPLAKATVPGATNIDDTVARVESYGAVAELKRKTEVGQHSLATASRLGFVVAEEPATDSIVVWIQSVSHELCVLAGI